MTMTTKTTTTTTSSTDNASSDAATQEWDVDLYQKQHSFVWKYGSSLLDLIDFGGTAASGTSSTSSSITSILDVGCGSGELTHALLVKLQQHHQYCLNEQQQQPQQQQQQHPSRTDSDSTELKLKVWGMDLDPQMIARAQEQYPEVDFFVGDVRNFQLPSSSSSSSQGQAQQEDQVDVLFSNAALHWVPPRDVSRAVASLSRAIKKGGQLVVELGGKGNVQKIVQAMKQVVKESSASLAVGANYDREGGGINHDDDSNDIWYFPSIADFCTELQNHGIEVTQAALFDRPTPFDGNEDGMKNWLRMFGGKFWDAAGATSVDQVERMLDQVCNLLRDDLYDERTRQWTADYRRIRVVGRKL